MRRTIQVTQTDIDDGVVEHGFACPIWCALRRQLMGEGRFCVNGDEVVFLDGTATGITESLPISAQMFVQSFDSQKSVEPFSFDLS